MSIDYVYRRRPVRLAMAAYDAFGNLFRKRRAPQPKGPPKRVCFVILHQIGDVVMALPTVRAIMEAVPDAKFSAVLGKATAPVFRLGVPDTVEVHEFNAAWQYAVQADPRTAIDARLDFITLIDQLAPDAVVVFHPDLVVNQLLGKSKVGHTFGFSNAGGGFFLSHPLEVVREGPQVERSFALAQRFSKVFGIPLAGLAAPRLEPVEKDVRRVREILSPGEFVAIHPFGRFTSRNWSPENWQKVFAWLCDRGLQPVVIGGPGDQASVYGGRLPCGRDLAGQLNLTQTAALLSMGKLFIGIDSGPGHIAAAVGCPVVSIFSSANTPERWAPYASPSATSLGLPDSKAGRGDPYRTGYPAPSNADGVIVLHSADIDRSKWPLEARDLAPKLAENPYTVRITPELVIGAVERILAERSSIE